MEPSEEDFETCFRYLFSEDSQPSIEVERAWVNTWLHRMVDTLIAMLPPAKTRYHPQTIGLAVMKLFYASKHHPRALEFMPEIFRLAEAFDLDDDLWSWCSTDDHLYDARWMAYRQAVEARFFYGCISLTGRRVRVAEALLKADPRAGLKLANSDRRLLDHYLACHTKLVLERYRLEREYQALDDKVLGTDMLRRMSEINSELDTLPLF